MEENVFLLDSSGREWCQGSLSGSPIVFKKIIILPIFATPMYPTTILDPSADYIYAICAKCNQIIPESGGLVALEVCATQWGIRIVCAKHCDYYYLSKTDIPIVNIASILTPIIEEACTRNIKACVVCDASNCTNEMCIQIKERGLLYQNRIEELVARFYRIKLDLVSPLLNTCEKCKERIDDKKWTCDMCRVVFCSKGCKKRAKKHNCMPIEDVFI